MSKIIIFLVGIVITICSGTPVWAVEEMIKFDPFARGLGARLVQEKIKNEVESQAMFNQFGLTPRFTIAYIDLNNDNINEILAFFDDEYFGLYDGKNINMYRFSVYRVNHGQLVEIGRFFADGVTISDQRIKGYYSFVSYDDQSRRQTHVWTGQSYD